MSAPRTSFSTYPRAPPGDHGIEQRLVVGERRQHETRELGVARHELAADLHPAAVGQLHVQHGDVGSAQRDALEGLHRGGGLADHLQARSGLEQVAHAAAHDLVVVEQEDPDGCDCRRDRSPQHHRSPRHHRPRAPPDEDPRRSPEMTAAGMEKQTAGVSPSHDPSARSRSPTLGSGPRSSRASPCTCTLHPAPDPFVDVVDLERDHRPRRRGRHPRGATGAHQDLLTVEHVAHGDHVGQGARAQADPSQRPGGEQVSTLLVGQGLERVVIRVQSGAAVCHEDDATNGRCVGTGSEVPDLAAVGVRRRVERPCRAPAAAQRMSRWTPPWTCW
jgi:hypothetical protein